MSVKRNSIIVLVLIVIGAGAYLGYPLASKLMVWRHLDQTYAEQFKPPPEIALELKGKKVIAAQMNLPSERMPDNDKAFLELMHQRGAGVFANTAMLIVTGDAEQVQAKIPDTTMSNRPLTRGWQNC